jgi:ClpP class serine protease
MLTLAKSSLPPHRLLDLTRPWLMETNNARQYFGHRLRMHEGLCTVREVVERETQERDALEQQPGKSPERGVLWTEYKGVATIQVQGPLVKNEDFWSYYFGEPSHQGIMYQLGECLNDSSIKAIILNIDSPGGEAAGTEQVGKMIFEGRQVKPIWAFGDGSVASGALWYATACSGVRLSPLAEMGSLGVVYTLYDMTKYMSELGVEEIEIVSVQSPYKRFDMSDAKQKQEGLSRIQIRANDTCQQFGEAVAMYRSVSVETAFSRFGRGDMMIAQKAVDCGLADNVGGYEELRDILAAGKVPKSGATSAKTTSTARAVKGANLMNAWEAMKAAARSVLSDDTGDAGEGNDGTENTDNTGATTPGQGGGTGAGVGDGTGDGEDADENGEDADEETAEEKVARLEAENAQLRGAPLNPTLQAQRVQQARATALNNFVAVARTKVAPADLENVTALYMSAQQGKVTPAMLESVFSNMQNGAHAKLARVDARRQGTAPVKKPVGEVETQVAEGSDYGKSYVQQNYGGYDQRG